MKTVTFKIHKSDYTTQRYSTIQNYLVLASNSGMVQSFVPFKNFIEITTTLTVYADLQNLINN